MLLWPAVVYGAQLTVTSVPISCKARHRLPQGGVRSGKAGHRIHAAMLPISRSTPVKYERRAPRPSLRTTSSRCTSLRCPTRRIRQGECRVAGQSHQHRARLTEVQTTFQGPTLARLLLEAPLLRIRTHRHVRRDSAILPAGSCCC